MGNFGKRILIVLSSVVLVVALTLVLNAYQQRDKNHTVSDQTSVVYQGSYDGLSYEINKQELWENILYSNALSNLNEMVNKTLLKNVISDVTEEEIASKKKELIYSTSDDDDIAKIKADPLNDAKLIESFNNRMTVLGYTSTGTDGKNINDYIKLQVAYDNYAKYRILNGLKTGAITPDVSDEKLKTEYLKKYEDTKAIVIKFYSETEALEILKKKYHVVVVSDVMRYYVGDSDYILSKNSNSSYYVEGDFSGVNYLSSTNTSLTLPYLEQEVTLADETTTMKNVPNENVKFTDNKYVWNVEDQAWEHDTTSPVSKKVAFDDATSFTTSNTAVLSSDQVLSLYISIYNEYYALQRDAISLSANYADFLSHYNNVEELNSHLQAFDLVVVDNHGLNEIRKYVGEEDYLVLLDDNGEAVSSNGYPSYQTLNSKAIPNYEIQVDEDGKPVLDFEKNFMYILDANGEKISKRVAIEDATSFTLANTVKASNEQLYQAYISLFNDDTNLTYNYDTINATRTDVAKSIFTTLTVNGANASSYLKKPTKFSGVNSSETPYYLIYKISSSAIADPSSEELAKYKVEKIEEYMDTSGFISLALAELRASAGITLYDEFFGYDYANLITYNSSSLVAGVNKAEFENYFTVKKYKEKELLKLTAKEVDVMGKKISLDKYTITTDDLYNYAMTYSSASYISSTCLNKMFLVMNEFAQIHGTSTNYLTSKNWKMKKYAEAAEYYNYYYEYYKQMYSQYSYDYYDSVEEFLYTYGARSFDDLVASLERSTMRSVFLYKELAGAMSSPNLSLTNYGKELYNSEKFQELFDDYYSVSIKHLLIYFDYDQDGKNDDYKKLRASFNEDGALKMDDGAGTLVALSSADLDNVIAELYDKLANYISENDATFADSSETIFSSFVKEYNESSLIDGEYKEFKQLGISLHTENLGEVTSLTASSFVKEFITAIEKVNEKLKRVDNDLLAYTILDGLTATEYGLHYIVGSAGTNYDKVDFTLTDDDNEYASGVVNSAAELSENQFNLYLKQYFYTAIYGDTDNPEINAGFAYPNLPEALNSAIDTYYSSYMTSILDSSSTYHSNYLMLTKLSSEASPYSQAFSELKDVYYSVLFGNLS